MQTLCLSVRKASKFVQGKLQNKQRNMVGPKAHGVMKCGEFEPLRTTLDSSSRRDENDNEVLATMQNLNPYLIVQITFKMLISLASRIKY